MFYMSLDNEGKSLAKMKLMLKLMVIFAHKQFASNRKKKTKKKTKDVHSVGNSNQMKEKWGYNDFQILVNVFPN